MNKQTLTSYSDEEIENEYFYRTCTTLGTGIKFYKDEIKILEEELNDALNCIEEASEDYKKLIRKHEDLEKEYCKLKCMFIGLKKYCRQLQGID